MRIVILILVFFVAIPIVFLNMPKKDDIIRIDCTLSEISPDFTNEMRQVCRNERKIK
jgi:short subunit fatty acids transporter